MNVKRLLHNDLEAGSLCIKRPTGRQFSKLRPHSQGLWGALPPPCLQVSWTPCPVLVSSFRQEFEEQPQLHTRKHAATWIIAEELDLSSGACRSGPWTLLHPYSSPPHAHLHLLCSQSHGVKPQPKVGLAAPLAGPGLELCLVSFLRWGIQRLMFSTRRVSKVSGTVWSISFSLYHNCSPHFAIIVL